LPCGALHDAGRIRASGHQPCSSCCCSAHHMLSYACMRRGRRGACQCSAVAPVLALRYQLLLLLLQMVALVDTGDWRWGWLGNKKPSHLLLLFPHAQQLLTTTTTSNPTFLCRRVRMLGASAGPRRGVSLGGVHHQQGRLGPRTPLAAMSVVRLAGRHRAPCRLNMCTLSFA